MSDDNRKMNKQHQGTGTVPKIKCRNNRPYPNERDSPRSWTSNNNNNLSSDFHHRLNLSDYLRNSRAAMNTSIEEQNLSTRSINGSLTPSSSTSRRNSSGTVPKCDNITKYPDKKQIEDKLSQIREYLQITTSLMSNMKNTDEQAKDELENMEQMVKDLKDSERKLVDILDSTNEMSTKTSEIIAKNEQILENGLVDAGSESELSQRNESDSNRDLEILREQQMSLLSLQQKAENKLKDARQIQEKLLSQYTNSVPLTTSQSSSNQQRDKNLSAVDAAIRELEERTKRLNETKSSPSSSSTTTTNLQDKLITEVDTLHNQIIALHNVNEDRNQLIQVLDNRDQELRAQHAELQNKLSELHNRKLQVDQLVSQLQHLEDGDDEDVAVQVKKIVTMKDQLSKLKDMLEIVKTTESIMQNTNATQEEQDLACGICTKAENFLQKTQIIQQNDNNVMRSEQNCENRIKQINKNTPSTSSERQIQQQQQQSNGAKPRTSNKNKLSVKAELEARKRELEELMGKHTAGPSNLNHDVGVDNKSEFSCSSNTFYDLVQGWTPTVCEHNRFDNTDRYSSDECPEDVNEFTEQQNQNFTLPLLNYQQSVSDNRSDHSYIQIQADQRANSRISNRNRANSEQTDKTQVQKQLELIRSVCDSMLEQQQQQQNSNVQQLRNNLTPSPLCSEPRHLPSPHPQSMNVLNVVNPLNDCQWVPPNFNMNQDTNNYQGWLTTNTLQTQAFMMNTLNQCCQMLWLQQRELAALRLTVNQLQERLENPTFDNQSHLTSPIQQPLQNNNSNNNRLINQQQQQQQKTNQQQVSSACSMPNLNQYNLPNIANIDPNYNHNNINNSNARLLDPSCLNNSNINTALQNLNDPQTINNSVLQQTANINHPLWNGQALNNQVAPGNRANNYWDNFRSYSRQNLLSTKSNDGSLQTTNIERTNPFHLMSTTITKSNSEQTTINSSQHETIPQQRRSQFTITRHNNDNNRTNLIPLQPDVLNVNHNLTKIETNQRNQNNNNNHNNNSVNNSNYNNLENDNNYQMYINNAFGYNETNPNNSNLSEEQILKDCIPETARKRNEWHEEQQNDEAYHTKSKLFEELRENVYKEVVTLISANETRPHFLIQLFRDLQMISSDPLRLKILQSIQTIITHSLISSTHLNTQSIDTQLPNNDQSLPTGNFSFQSTVWSKSIKNPSTSIPIIAATTTTTTQEIDTIGYQNTLKDILPFLNDHEDDIISHHFLNQLKQILINSETFQETVRDTAFKKHFSNVLDEELGQFIGKKAADVKMHILQSISELLRGELSFIQLIQDTCPNEPSNDVQNSLNLVSIFDTTPPVQSNNKTNDNQHQIENGDLAEADQERGDSDDDDDDDDTEEEGAVGGFWDHLETTPLVLSNTTNSEEVNVSTIQYQNSTEAQNQFSKQGLDQVPIRLPTKSRSNTPNKDRSHADHQEQF